MRCFSIRPRSPAGATARRRHSRLALIAPRRVDGVFFFGGNVDPSGVKPFPENDPLIGRIFDRHVSDYARLSATPHDFQRFLKAVETMMASQPKYEPRDLARIATPFTVVHAENDEFIKREHAELIAKSISGAAFVELANVGHFAPLQRPAEFNDALLTFLETLR